jgi:hypothetical protein
MTRGCFNTSLHDLLRPSVTWNLVRVFEFLRESVLSSVRRSEVASKMKTPTLRMTTLQTRNPAQKPVFERLRKRCVRVRKDSRKGRRNPATMDMQIPVVSKGSLPGFIIQQQRPLVHETAVHGSSQTGSTSHLSATRSG